jgi:hypothetical protein
MRTNGWISLLWALGLVTPACFEDRPVYVAVTPSTPGTAGTSGTPGVAGSDGSSGTTGFAGTDGTGGTTGSAGTGGIAPQGCPQVGQIFENKYCALQGACHDANGAAANFSLAGLPFSDLDGWRNRLVGKVPKGGGEIASICGASNSRRAYLVAGSLPATGLLLDKLRNANPSCGDQMPTLGDRLTAVELDCVQRWANALTPIPASTTTCPLSCGPGTYCRHSSTSSGVQTPGVWACYPIPAACMNGLTCGCLSTSCFNCEQRQDHYRCFGE